MDPKSPSLLQRALRSLRARSYKSNCSGWYAAAASPRPVAGATDSTLAGLTFSVLQGSERHILHTWLFEHRKRYPWVYLPAEIAAAERFGHRYPCLYAGDELVGFVKLGVETVHIHDFEGGIRLPAGAAFIYDTFIHPDYQRRGMARAMLARTLGYLAAQGMHAVFCHIEDWNQASIKTFDAAGFARIGTVRYRRVTWARWLEIDGSPASVKRLTGWLDGKLGELPPT